MVLQHAMFAAVMSVAETAVADDALCGVLTILETASNFPCRHASAQR